MDHGQARIVYVAGQPHMFWRIITMFATIATPATTQRAWSAVTSHVQLALRVC